MEPSVTLRQLDLEGIKILAVDADHTSLRSLSDILRDAGCALAEAGSTAQALEVYATFRPDFVLLDAKLPGSGGGFETCRQLRQTHGDECAPVIFLTPRNEPDDTVEWLGAGGADYLSRPFKAKEVLARIRLHLKFRILSEQFNQANAEKNRLLGMAAHDLRGPLGAIRGVAEFLREGAVGPLSPDQLELIETIYTTSRQVLELVNELLDVASIDSGELNLLLQPCDLGELLSGSVALMNMEAARKKIRVVFNPPLATPVLQLDAAKIKQVVDNLLSNAVKYSPPGSTVTVFVLPDVAGGTCAFCVRDQGVGIPEGEREKLFKDFGRLSVRPTGGEKSTGLGLVICRKIVEAHDGTIAAENLSPRGCEFRVTLPVRR